MLWRLSQMQEENQTMNSSSDFGCDVCVVGKGLLGSATARHLAEMDLNVLLLPLINSCNLLFPIANRGKKRLIK